MKMQCIFCGVEIEILCAVFMNVIFLGTSAQWYLYLPLAVKMHFKGLALSGTCILTPALRVHFKELLREGTCTHHVL
jgi:hypothetical protein